MAHTCTSCLMHIVFSTKLRQPLITQTIETRLHAYLGGVVREIGGTTLAVGGWIDHVHVLADLPTSAAIAKSIQIIKTNSSRWMHDTTGMAFAWQEGYGAFSISRSHIDDTTAYIQRQAEHHRHHTFQEEYRIFLDRNGITPDERYLWG
jgi:REP element-mobilizing transposase RayT